MPRADALGRIQALAVDFDRTLTDASLRPHSAALRALRLARERGRRVVIVSGRDRAFLTSEIGDAADLVVAENGCIVATRDAPPRRLGRDADAIHRALAGLDVPIERGEVICAADASHRALIEQALRDARVSADLILNRDRIMVVPRGVDKAAGALDALALMGVRPERAAAAGDAENDVVMLRAVGFAIAVGNALPEVKRVAHHVTQGFGGEGLARWIEDEWLRAEVPA